MERSEAQEKARQDAQGQFQESCKALIERAVDHDVPWLWVSSKIADGWLMRLYLITTILSQSAV